MSQLFDDAYLPLFTARASERPLCPTFRVKVGQLIVIVRRHPFMHCAPHPSSRSLFLLPFLYPLLDCLSSMVYFSSLSQ